MSQAFRELTVIKRVYCCISDGMDGLVALAVGSFVSYVRIIHSSVAG